MSEYIHNQSMDKVLSTEQFYTLIGNEDYLDSSDGSPKQNSFNENTYAKKITRDDGSIRYSVRVDTDGKFYNPINIYSQNLKSTFLDNVCRNADKYKNVNYKVFNLYITFLKTKNLAWLHNAEREAT